jgi:hypothetical protein
MTYSELCSYYLRKAGKILFVSFVSICVAVCFLLLLQIAGAREYWYFAAGTFYCLVNSLINKAAKLWREGIK